MDIDKLREDYDFCIKRAEQYLDQGDAAQAVASFASDVRNYPDLKARIPDFLLAIGVFETLNGVDAVRKWLYGFPRP